MKIISQENYNKNEIEYSLKKDLLIPCFVYRIPIETSRNKDLNFIEETILKLIQIDDSLKNDVVRLSKMLGFYNEKSTEDKTKIISLILRKIKDLRIDDEAEKANTEVTIYQFYQEAYTNELLPLITKEINEFSYPEKDYPYNESSNRQISFKKHVHSKKSIKAVLAKWNEVKPIKPTKADIIKTIYMHNQNRYKGSHTIDYSNFNIEVFKSELIYLHVKLYIPKNNIKSFVITNGFTNDFSTALRKVYEYKHQDLLKLIRSDMKSDVESSTNDDFNIPFEDKINSFRELRELIKTIEIENEKLQQDEIKKDEVKKSKDRYIQSLYDLIEKVFAIFSNDLEANKTLQNKTLVKSLAKEFGFKINTQKHLSIFNVNSRDNLQKYIAKSLIYKKNELYDIAKLFPDLFFTLTNLLSIRNGVKHSEKDKTLEQVNEDDLKEYRKIIYEILTIVLKINQKIVSQNDMDNDDNIHMQNAYIDLEKEIKMDVMDKLPEEVKDNLTSINFYLYSADFNTNKFNIVKEVINSLYSSFEFIVRKIINTIAIDNQNIVPKDEVLKKIRETIEIGESLYRVSPQMIEQAFKKQGASLGAYMLIYLYYKKDINIDDAKLIERIISLRGHGSPNIEDVEKTTKEDLIGIKNKSFKLVEKLIEEI